MEVEARNASHYNHMIKTFQHKGLRAFFETGRVAGIQAAHASKLGAMLRRLNEVASPQGMNLPGWRLTFKFEGTDIILVDYWDYH